MRGIYVIYNPDGTAYVGKSEDMVKRRRVHEYYMGVLNVNSRWVVYRELSFDADIDVAEYEAIAEVGKDYELTNKDVVAKGSGQHKTVFISNDGETWLEFNSQKEAATCMGVLPSYVAQALRGATGMTKGWWVRRQPEQGLGIPRRTWKTRG